MSDDKADNGDRKQERKSGDPFDLSSILGSIQDGLEEAGIDVDLSVPASGPPPKARESKLGAAVAPFPAHCRLTSQRRDTPMNRPMIVQPSALLTLFLSWVALLAGAFVLGLRMA